MRVEVWFTWVGRFKTRNTVLEIGLTSWTIEGTCTPRIGKLLQDQLWFWGYIRDSYQAKYIV